MKSKGLMIVAYIVLALVTAFSIKLTRDETINRQQSVCQSQNAIKIEILEYLQDLSRGEQLQSVPVPEGFSAKFKIYEEAKRQSSRAFNASAYDKAKVQFALKECS